MIHHAVEMSDLRASFEVCVYPRPPQLVGSVNRRPSGRQRTWCSDERRARAPARCARLSGDVSDVDDNVGMLIASTSQQRAGWRCLRALTTAAAIDVDILTCADEPTGALAAQRIACEIADRVTGQ
jgi:hypothetical protein